MVDVTELGPCQLRIDGRWRDPKEFRVPNPRLLPDTVNYPGGWLAYGVCGRIKPENWRYVEEEGADGWFHAPSRDKLL